MEDNMEKLESPCVEVTDPEGNVFEFRFVTAIESGGQTYVLLNDALAEERGEEQLVAIRVEKTADGEMEYVLPMDPQEVEAVMDQYMLLSMRIEERTPPVLH